MADRRQSLIVACAVALLAAVWGAAGYSQHAYVAERFADSDAQAAKLAIAFEEHTQGILQYADLRLSAVRAEYLLRGGVPAARQLLASLPFDEKVVALIGIADASGKGWGIDSKISPDRTFSIAERDYFQYHRDHPDDVLMVSPPRAGMLVPEVNFRLSRRISAPDGSFAGVVFAAVSPKVITAFYDRFEMGPNASVALLRSDHVLLARRGPTPPGGEQPLGKRMEGNLWQLARVDPVGGSREASPADGIVRMFAYRSLPNAPLLVDVGIADQDVLATTTGYRQATLAAALIASLVVVLGSLAVSRQTATSARLDAANRRATQLSTQIARVLNCSSVSILHLKNRRIVFANQHTLATFGYDEAELVGSDTRILYPSEAEYVAAGEDYAKLLAGPLLGREGEFRRRDGSTLWCRSAGRLIDPADPAAGIIWVLDDITERRRTEETLRKLSQVVEQGPISVIITDVNGVIEYVNPEFCAKTGYTPDEVIGQNPRILKSDERSSDEYGVMWATITQGLPWQGIFHNRRKDGSLYWEDAVIAPVRDAAGRITHFVAIKQDVSERKAAEAHVEFLAHHDSLTGLPNRVLARDRWDQALAYAERSGNKVGLMFIDLDNFKAVNDALGHPAGDRLLRGVAARLRECVRDTDTISRQGGDEFLVVLSDIRDAEAIGTIADKIRQRLVAPFDIDGREVVTSLSIGLCIHPDDGSDFDGLLQKADMAMYHAKEAGRNTHRFFTEQMNVDADQQLRMRTSLRRALSRGEFVLHYQPQADLIDGRVIGAEALIRWNHPDLGLLPPGRFIAVAEDSGLIVPIGQWVLEEACRQAAEWQVAGSPPITIAVNLSAVQFKHGDLLAVVSRALAAAPLPPSCLELELTESILIEDVETALKTLADLKALGVKLSIDDFGTGYSSLSYLKRFDVDKLKIDQSFVRDISANPNDAAIVHAIVQMARSLGLKTIAEGVENQHVIDCLRSHDCDEVQGYHLARPMPADEIIRFLASARERGRTDPPVMGEFEPGLAHRR